MVGANKIIGIDINEDKSCTLDKVWDDRLYKPNKKRECSGKHN